MKDIEIKISKDTRMVELSQTTIGNDGENLQAKLVFSFGENEFVNGQARLEYSNGGEKLWVVAEKIDETYQVPILSVMTSEGKIDMQLVITEGTDENEIPIFKSNMFYVYCNSSINAEIEQPEEYPEWIDEANAKLNQMDNMNVEMKDGVVTITKKDGTKVSEDVRGPAGPQGADGAIKLIVVNELPTDNIDESAIYLKPSENPAEENVFEEYVYANGSWEKISGGASVDLTGYATEDYVNDVLNNFVPEIDYEPEYFYLECSSVSATQINYLDYKTKCLKFNKFVPILVNMRNSYFPQQQTTIMVYPVIKPSDGSLIRFIGLNDCHISNTSTLDGFGVINVAMSISSIDAIPETGTFNLTFKTVSYLKTDNTDEYTPTSNYHPATKKYVDDKVGNINAVLATLTEVSE